MNPISCFHNFPRFRYKCDLRGLWRATVSNFTVKYYEVRGQGASTQLFKHCILNIQFSLTKERTVTVYWNSDLLEFLPIFWSSAWITTEMFVSTSLCALGIYRKLGSVCWKECKLEVLGGRVNHPILKLFCLRTSVGNQSPPPSVLQK